MAQLQEMPDSGRPVVTALDLPESMYRDGISRECINENTSECDFTRRFSPMNGPVAMDCNDSFKGRQLGVTSAIAVKPAEPYDLVDRVIVY